VLSKVSGIEKSSVVLFLDALEKDGWVERRPHPGDRRAHRVHLTENGRARFTQIGLKLKAAQDEALSVFAPDEREAFERYLLRLIEGLRR
jgi:DNA-binding MarR family transcriptional regulator